MVLKSTVEPQVTQYLNEKYKLNIVHSPEFVSSTTAYIDIRDQYHIVIGKPPNFKRDDLFEKLIAFYKLHYPTADTSIITSTESELMKLAVNSFYAVKIQYFNEIYNLCDNLDISYDTVKNTMLKNNWINPMHTQVPGCDGELSYGGMCLPKDTRALNQFLIKNTCYNMVLDSTIKENNLMRNN